MVIELDFEVLHGFVKRFQLANEVVPFKSEFFLSNTHVSDLLFLVNQFVPGCVQFLLTLVDFTHVGACLELVLLRELALIFAKALDFLIESFYLEMGFIELLSVALQTRIGNELYALVERSVDLISSALTDPAQILKKSCPKAR